LGEKLGDGPTDAWAMRVYHKPFVTWIWFGCLIMAIGGCMAVLDRRYRKKLAKASEAVGSTTGKMATA